MRIVFLGSSEFGLPTLAHLCAAHEVAAVVSQPDRPQGRHRRLTPMPIARYADEHGLTVHKCDDVNTDDFIALMRRHHAEAAVVVAFGQKLSQALVAALGKLALNLHASLLAKYRGAAPINWAMIRGETKTGVSVISLAQRLDAGLVYAQAATPIDPLESAGQLHDRLARMGPDVIERVLRDFQSGTLRGRSQDESQATRAPKLSKSDGWVAFDAPAEQVRCRIHGLTPWPGVRVRWRRQATGQTQPLTLRRVRDHADLSSTSVPGTVLEGFRVATGRGVIELLEVQPPGKRPMDIAAFARGHAIAAGDVLIGNSGSGSL